MAKRPFRKPSEDKQEQPSEKLAFSSAGEPMRLNRYLAHAGVASRRKADSLIADGLVAVNGVVVKEMGLMVEPKDKVTYQGKLVRPQRFVYVLLNKPRGFVTTTDDERGRKTVMDLLGEKVTQRVYPVGRLDRQTMGLLLLTNDGGLAEHLMHPRYEIEKVYSATLNKPMLPEDLEKIAAGLTLEDGPIKVDEVAFTDSRDASKVGLALHTGRNRIVRRIFEHLGYTVEQLDRVIYAGLTKKDLQRGKWRHLNPVEIAKLKHFGQGGRKPDKGRA